MSDIYVETGTGLELVEREAVLILFNELNDELEAQQELWEPRDAEYAETLGQEPDFVILEPVESENFHYGHKPSLIQSPPKESYPNVAVMAYEGNPAPVPIDQAEDFRITVDVELMCKADEEEGERTVNRRTHRTTEAVVAVLNRNSDLNGLSIGWDNDPRTIITDVFSRPDEGKQWFWQAARIRYTMTKHSNLA